MVLRAFRHKSRRLRLPAAAACIALTLGVAACVEADAVPAGSSESGNAASGVASRGSSGVGSTAMPPAGHAWVIFGTDTVLAEVASTPEERAEGLMYRDDVPDGTGMLFVFEDSRPRSFWMANTYVPLDIAYMDPSYRIVDIVAMEPLVEESYPSDAPAMFGLEVRQGWFEEQDIGVGAQANIVFGVQGR